jgi:hypothetical protein
LYLRIKRWLMQYIQSSFSFLRKREIYCLTFRKWRPNKSSSRFALCLVHTHRGPHREIHQAIHFQYCSLTLLNKSVPIIVAPDLRHFKPTYE